jgi:hypothetical protein
MNVDRWMEKAKNRIKAIGIEVEGGWDSPTAAKAIMRDGSVVFPQVNTNRIWLPSLYRRDCQPDPHRWRGTGMDEKMVPQVR